MAVRLLKFSFALLQLHGPEDMTLFLCWDSEGVEESEDSVVKQLFRAADEGDEDESNCNGKRKGKKSSKKRKKSKKSSSSSSNDTESSKESSESSQQELNVS